MAKVILNTPITTDRYGLHFEKGEAYTNNEYLINKLIRKGVKVEIENLEVKTNTPEKKTIDEMTIAELKNYATENNIEIPSKVKSKADIIEFLKNPVTDPGEDNSGEDNSGEDNSGEDNSGEDNSGEDNSGEDNSGEDNSGEDNPGESQEGNPEAGADSNEN